MENIEIVKLIKKNVNLFFYTRFSIEIRIQYLVSTKPSSFWYGHRGIGSYTTSINA